MNPVPISTIPAHFDTKKSSVGLIVICNGEILVQEDKLQGRIIYNTFGAFVKNNDYHKQIMTVQKEELGTSYDLTLCGTMVEYIQKPAPDGRVQLTSQAYKLQLNNDQKSDLKPKDNQFWINKETIEKTKAIREEDKIILKRILDNIDVDLVMDVDQMNKWIDARLLAWAIASNNNPL